jgi:hypothetical protein
MKEGNKDPAVVPFPSHVADDADGLPFVIEIWDLPRTAVERVIARVASLNMARTVFESAASENPARRLVLRRGERILEDRT